MVYVKEDGDDRIAKQPRQIEGLAPGQFERQFCTERRVRTSNATFFGTCGGMHGCQAIIVTKKYLKCESGSERRISCMEEVMVFSLSPPPTKYRTNPYTPSSFQFLLSRQTKNSSSTSSSLSELMSSLDSQSFFASISS